MTKLGENISGLNLKCDFPAREPFREALLERLLAIKDQQAERGNDAQLADDDLEVRALSDDELEMLAAAKGQPISLPDWLSEGGIH